MAGTVSEKFGSDVKVDVIYKGVIGAIIENVEIINPPNLYVGDVELGKNATQEQLEIVVVEMAESDQLFL
jgi:hypothetical protein